MSYVPPRYITLDDVFSRFGESAVSRLLCHDGGGDPNPDAVTALIEEASGAADTFLMASFTTTVVEKLSADPRFRGAVCDIFMSLAGEQKQEFGGGDSEKAPYAGHRKRGETTLMLLGKGAQRMGAEETHGVNPTLKNRTTVSLPYVHQYATSRTNPRGSGGF